MSNGTPPKLVRLIAGAGSAIGLAFAGSLLGAAGTIAGAALGSVLSAVIADALTAGGTRLHRKVSGWQRRRLILGAVTAVAAFAAAAGVITVAEAAAGKPVSAIVQGHKGSGTTFGGPVTPPSPAPSVTASPSPSSPSPSVTPSTSATSPLVTLTPTATVSSSIPVTSPASSTPEPSPSTGPPSSAPPPLIP